MYDPYLALWPGLSDLPSPARISFFSLSLIFVKTNLWWHCQVEEIAGYKKLLVSKNVLCDSLDSLTLKSALPVTIIPE